MGPTRTISTQLGAGLTQEGSHRGSHTYWGTHAYRGSHTQATKTKEYTAMHGLKEQSTFHSGELPLAYNPYFFKRATTQLRWWHSRIAAHCNSMKNWDVSLRNKPRIRERTAIYRKKTFGDIMTDFSEFSKQDTQISMRRGNHGYLWRRRTVHILRETSLRCILGG